MRFSAARNPPVLHVSTNFQLRSLFLGETGSGAEKMKITRRDLNGWQGNPDVAVDPQRENTQKRAPVFNHRHSVISSGCYTALVNRDEPEHTPERFAIWVKTERWRHTRWVTIAPEHSR